MNRALMTELLPSGSPLPPPPVPPIPHADKVHPVPAAAVRPRNRLRSIPLPLLIPLVIESSTDRVTRQRRRRSARRDYWVTFRTNAAWPGAAGVVKELIASANRG